jgi:thiamine-phosphate pyrophosphorylase
MNVKILPEGPFGGRDVFWPPADELMHIAEAIRERFREWPRTNEPWRIYLSAPGEPRAGDLMIFTEEGKPCVPGCMANAWHWLAQGAGVIEAFANRVELRLGESRYALERTRPLAEDWLAALACFIDFGLDTHDALVLALALGDID